MPKPTLDEFLQSDPSRRNAYVEYPGFKHLYVRLTQRYLRGSMANPVLDIANIEVKKKGKGTFTGMITYLREKYPHYWLYVECVLQPRFERKLLTMGFTQVGVGLVPSFYLPPVEDVCRKTKSQVMNS